MAKLCKCGCGQEIIILRHHKWVGIPDYIRGHGMKGTKRTDITKNKISMSRQGKFGGEKAGFYGKHHTDGNKQIQSMLRQEQYSNGNNPFQGKTHTAETIKKISDKALVRNASPEYREMISQTTKNAMTEEICNHLSEIGKERCSTPEWRKMKSEEGTNRWKNDKEFAERMRNSRNARPNKSETFLGNLLDETYPNEWKFVGDFSFILNGKNPDFVNCNGKKLIIELFGEPWHKGETQEDRSKFFTPFGYRTLVVWWEELKKVDILKSKIERFVNEIHI